MLASTCLGFVLPASILKGPKEESKNQVNELMLTIETYSSYADTSDTLQTNRNRESNSIFFIQSQNRDIRQILGAVDGHQHVF